MWRRALVLITVGLLASGGLRAQEPPPGDPAALNAQSKALSDSDAAQSAALARQALDSAREADNAAEAAEALHNLAAAHRNLASYALALDFAQQSANAYAAIGDRKGEAQGYNTLGLVAADQGDFPTSLEYHLKALEIREAIGDRQGLSYSYNNLGNMYRNVRDFERAIEYHQKALALKEELGDQGSLAFSHHNLGTVYRTMGDAPRALESLRRGLAIRESLGDKRAMASSYNAIALTLEPTDPVAALAEYRKALAIREEINDRRGIAGTLTNIGNTQRRLDRPGDAVATLTRALALAREIEAPVIEIEVMQNLAEAEAARGNFRAAYDWHQQYAALEDKTFNQQNSDRLNRMNIAYQAAQREQEIALLNAQAELNDARLTRQRTLIAAAVVVSLVLLLLYLHRRRSEQRYRQQAERLSEALLTAKTLRGLLPVCAECKRIRDEGGAWHTMEHYIMERSDANFTHGYCPTCSNAMLNSGGNDPRLM